MTLRLKINLAMGIVFIIGLVATSYLSKSILHSNAKSDVINHAGMMMESALAVRNYTVKEVKPLIKDQLVKTFHPQSVPSYAATTYFNTVREKHKEYHYKEATLNPTNPKDKAVDWETDIIKEFSDDKTKKEIIGERNTPTGLSLYLARPIRITNPDCLSCHSVPSKAPQSMIDLYGPNNGFNWKLDEVVGAQIVSVPLSYPIRQADRTHLIFILCFVIIFAICFLVVNGLISIMILKPINQITNIAEKVSAGNMNAPEFKEDGKDEISKLGGSFNRMRRSLDKAMEMLDEDD